MKTFWKTVYSFFKATYNNLKVMQADANCVDFELDCIFISITAKSSSFSSDFKWRVKPGKVWPMTIKGNETELEDLS
ncbi:hypothetical protein TNCV_3793521 [Trichonephila clavipes]|nr:hypothetical protein TNCV_3793521 [Trichonephila clavipes]